MTDSSIRSTGGGAARVIGHGGDRAALQRRADSDLDRRQATLSHDGLNGRASSMPHHGTRPPRTGLPPLPPPAPVVVSGRTDSLDIHLGSMDRLDADALLATGERSDRFTEGPAIAAMRGMGPADIESGPPSPPAERSWRATVGAVFGQAADAVRHAASSVGQKIGHLGGVVGGELAGQASSFGLVMPRPRLAAAAAGHLIHQSVTVGVPTFLREMMAEAMVLSMRHMPPHHALALQISMGVVNVGAQVMRRTREARNPDAAARGFHAMTPEQWNGLSDAQKTEKRRQQVAHSRMVTNLQIMASLTHITVGVMAARSETPDTEKAVKLFVTDFKSMVYAGMRDSLQASFSMVGTAGPTAGGVSGTHMTASAEFYALANVGGNYAFTYLPGLTPHAKAADDVLRGTSTAMSTGEAWMTKAAVAAVKAAINTAVEAADWFSVTQHEANQAGTVQRWDPKLKFLDPGSRDYGRLMDQTPARMTAIGAGNAIFTAVGFAMKDQPEWARVTTANLLEAAYEGLKYKTIGGTWQADGAVRAEPSAVRIEELDVEAGTDAGPSRRSETA